MSVSTNVRRYRKKPIIVEAMRWRGNEDFAVASRFVGEDFMGGESDGSCRIFNAKESQVIRCPLGHWIIRGVAGEFYPCSPDVFEATYEAVVT